MHKPMTLHEHITLEAYEATLMRSRWTRAWGMSKTLAAGLFCSALTLGSALAQIGGAL